MAGQAQQSLLFVEMEPKPQGNPKKDLPDWSISKRDQLEQCPRRYYYQRYGSAARTATSDLLKEKLQFYRSLSNSWLLSGILLHAKIRESFQALRSGTGIKPEEMVSVIGQRWERARETSIQFAKGGNLKGVPGKVLLLEYIFKRPDADAMWGEAGERLVKALNGFLTLPDLERFRRGGLTPEAAIEKKVKVEGPGFRMRGQIDLAWPENGCVTVADWKSGGRNSGDSDLQLLAYALAAKQHFNCGLGDLDLYRVELDSGRAIRQEVNETEAARARARMAQDTVLMINLDKYGRAGIAEAFTPTGSQRICRLCPYQRICPGSEA
ncbi:MAG: PD-(D/E)XK nuclease family protein [Acidobacteria bacterium]|nr:PD-(D/E)XK nuclease family protein [Acidobacteriota bacterium]